MGRIVPTFILVFLAALQSIGSADASANTPPWMAEPRDADDVPPPQALHWHVMAQRFRDEMEAQKPRVVFLGDSVFERWADRGAASWERYFVPRGAVDLGVAGTTQNLLWRREAGNSTVPRQEFLWS